MKSSKCWNSLSITYIWLVSTSFKIYLENLSNFYITFTIFYYNTISLKCTFFPVLVKGTGTCFIQKIHAPPLPYFKVNIYPFPLPHFASIFVAYLWSFRWPNYIVTLPRYFSFRLPHLNIPSDELDKNKNSQRTWLSENFSHWNGYSHFRFALDFSYAFGIL
jgi:hypothetical protein